MSKSTPALPSENGLVVAESGSTLAKVNAYLGGLPTVQDDPTETMLEAILASPNPADWDAIFTSWHLKDSDKMQVRINAYRPSESQFEGKLTHFLVLDVTDLRTGVKGVLTCGSIMAIAQVLNAERTVGLPIDVEVTRKPTPTKGGFHPIHFKFLGRDATPLGDPQAVVSEQ